MSLLELAGVGVEAGGRPILDLEALAVREGEVLAVLGPTGAGKSTLLRVAGLLLRPTRGTLAWRGAAVRWPAPLALRRRVTMAFQDPLLLSGTALDNVLFGLALRGERDDAARDRAREVLRLLRVEARADQPARTLSAGEAQRTALARALVIRPDLLLLDEPLASLDEPIREELRAELAAIVRRLGLTCVLVTHDQVEARAMSDRVAVLDGGRLRQVGTPDEVFSRPADRHVARFVGTANTLPGTVAACRGELVEVAVGGTMLTARSRLEPGRRVVVCIRPEEVELVRGAAPAGDGANRLAAAVVEVVDRPQAVAVRLECGFPLEALLPRRAARALRPGPGETLTAVVPAEQVHLIAEPG